MDKNEKDTAIDDNLDSLLNSLLQDSNKDNEEQSDEEELNTSDPDQDILDLLNSIGESNQYPSIHQEEDIFSIDDSNLNSGDNFSMDDSNFNLEDNLSVDDLNINTKDNFSIDDSNFNFEDNFSIDDSNFNLEDNFSVDVSSLNLEDTFALEENDLESLTSEKKEDLPKKSTQDVGEVFSEALGAVDSLEDEFSWDEDLLNLAITENEEKTMPKALQEDKEDKKSKKASLKNELKANKEKQSVAEKKSGKEKKSKKKKSKSPQSNVSLFNRIFGNVKKNYSPEEIEALKQKGIEEIDQKIKKQEDKKASATKKKEEKKKLAAENAAKKKAEAIKLKELKAKAKQDAQARKALEIQNLMTEIDEDEGKINRVGATVIFVFFASLALGIVIGTKLYSYKISIESATSNFSAQRYNEAYDEVYGMQIKDEDIEIYNKIMTVMFVNKQLNSYNNYFEMEKYPQALDSLLKGLERYDEYKQRAEKLGIESDLDYVREKLLSELKNEFKLSEAQALKINKIEDQEKYSLKVYNVVLEQMDTEFTKSK